MMDGNKTPSIFYGTRMATPRIVEEARRQKLLEEPKVEPTPVVDKVEPEVHAKLPEVPVDTSGVMTPGVSPQTPIATREDADADGNRPGDIVYYWMARGGTDQFDRQICILLDLMSNGVWTATRFRLGINATHPVHAARFSEVPKAGHFTKKG